MPSDVGINAVSTLGGVTGRGFMPGRSGNPNGRPKGDVQALARQHTERAILTLVESLDDPKLKVQAAVALLDRGWGKPVQEIASENGDTVTFLHLVAMRAFSDELNAQRVVDGNVVADATNDTPNAPRNLMEPATE
jgi:hypothetical protein